MKQVMLKWQWHNGSHVHRASVYLSIPFDDRQDPSRCFIGKTIWEMLLDSACSCKSVSDLTRSSTMECKPIFTKLRSMDAKRRMMMILSRIVNYAGYSVVVDVFLSTTSVLMEKPISTVIIVETRLHLWLFVKLFVDVSWFESPLDPGHDGHFMSVIHLWSYVNRSNACFCVEYGTGMLIRRRVLVMSLAFVINRH